MEEKLFSAILRNVSDGIVAINPDLQVIYLNPAAVRLCGWSAEDAYGKPAPEVLSLIDSVDLSSVIPGRLPSDDTPAYFRDVILKNREDDISIIDGSITRIQNTDDTSSPAETPSPSESFGYVMIFRDISEAKKMSAMVDFEVSHDNQSGLNNAETFAVRLRETIDLLKREAGSHALMELAVDQYDKVCDDGGDAAVDELIRQLAVLIRSNTQRRDITARLDGGRFGLIVRDCRGEDARRVAERLLGALDDYKFLFDGNEYTVSFSIGVMPLDSGDESPDAAMAALNKLCREASAQGGNRIVYKE